MKDDISRLIWKSKYRYTPPTGRPEADLQETWHRVAGALAAVEYADRSGWERRFFELLDDGRFLPGGRILAGAGSARQVTLFNCFVMGVIEDSMDGIFDALKEGAITMQHGGGVGYDFSTLRPRGEPAASAGTIASGPVSFMRIWDSMCATLLSTGARRGAMMATLRCDHPDIEAFIEAKSDARELRHFNLSVQVTDDFMAALAADEDWPLVFPAQPGDEGELIRRDWPGRPEPVPCRVYRRVSARDLWARLMRATYDYAEPGVLFVDRVNRHNNLWYREHITATNPCGEIPLPPYGACDLGSINLTRFVVEPFTGDAHVDWDALAATAATAVRMLDNAIEASRFPLPQQAEQARGSRRLGLGVTGLADALIMLGLAYDSPTARRIGASMLRTVRDSAYRTSVTLSRDKGPFPYFERDRYLEGEYIQSLPEDIRDGIGEFGIRNSHLLAIAPAGTISLLADNVSSGIEPVYADCLDRKVLQADGGWVEVAMADYACVLWTSLGRDGLPPALRLAHRIAPEEHLRMQAALQPLVDNAISKTVNVPEDFPFEDFVHLYESANELGLKGCTTFRPNKITGEILHAAEAARHCCAIEREAD